MIKLAFSICKNKAADQLCSKCTADQRLCFCFMDSVIPLLLKSKILGFYPTSETVQAGLYWTCSEILKTCVMANSKGQGGNDNDKYIRSRLLLHTVEVWIQFLQIWWYSRNETFHCGVRAADLKTSIVDQHTQD